jgi:hypothetical protein
MYLQTMSSMLPARVTGLLMRFRTSHCTTALLGFTLWLFSASVTAQEIKSQTQDSQPNSSGLPCNTHSPGPSCGSIAGSTVHAITDGLAGGAQAPTDAAHAIGAVTKNVEPEAARAFGLAALVGLFKSFSRKDRSK